MDAIRRFTFGLSLTVAIAAAVSAQDSADPHELAAEACIETDAVEACMAGYGFSCSRYTAPQAAIGAYRISCNAPLADGRTHFVQILNDTEKWTIQVQRAYTPEYATDEAPGNDPESLLDAYVQDQMADYNAQLSGAVPGPSRAPVHIKVGTQRAGNRIAMRVVCGMVMDTGDIEDLASEVRHVCQQRFLRSIRMLSQAAADGPFRVPSVDQIAWQSMTISVGGNADAFVVEGWHDLPMNHRPCRYISDCCSRDGSTYLNSCRAPTESELEAIAACLAEGVRVRTDEFEACLRDRGVPVGCEIQADGSSLCY